MELLGFGVDHQHLLTVVHCTPAHIHQVRAGFAVTERRTLVHSRYTFWPRQTSPRRLVVPARPAFVRAACHPHHRCADQAALRLLPDRYDDPAETVSHHLSINQRYVAHSSAAKKVDAALSLIFNVSR